LKFSLNTEMIRNSNLSNYDIAAYIALKQAAQMSHILQRETFNITASQIPDILYQCLEQNVQRREKEGLQQGLSNIASLEQIKPDLKTEYKKQQIYVYDTELIMNDTDCFGNVTPKDIPKYFTSISTTEVYSIFAIPNVDHYALLRLFVVILSTLTIQHKHVYKASKQSVMPNAIGLFSQQSLATMSGMHIATVRKYIETLKENKLLYIAYYKLSQASGNTLTSSACCYGRYSDKQCVIDCAKDRDNISSKNKLSQSQANNNRRLKQIYNNILKGKSYPDSDIIASYNYIQSKNKTLSTPFPVTIYDNFDCIRKISEQNVEV